MDRRSRRARLDRQVQKDQVNLLWLLRSQRGLNPLAAAALGRRVPAAATSFVPYDDFDNLQQPPAPPRPDAIGGDWSDRSVSAPPKQTFSLVLQNKPEPEMAETGGPVRRLTALAADVVARHLDAYDQTLWNDGPEGMSIELARHVVCALQKGRGVLDRAAWVLFVGGYGPGVLPTPEIKRDPSLGAVDNLALGVPFAELLHTLRSSPPTCDLLRLNGLAHFAGDHVLTQLDLSDTAFGDFDCKAIKDLRFLRVLSSERTPLTDAGVRFLTSALYTEAASTSADSRASIGRGLLRLGAWSMRGCVGVTDRAAVNLRSWAGLCYIDIRQSSATPSAFVQILNRPGEVSSPSKSRSAVKFALTNPPEAGATLLDTLLASPSRFPFLAARSSAAICSITTDMAKCRNKPSTATYDKRPKLRTTLTDTSGADVEQPVGLVPRSTGLVPTPLGSTMTMDVVLVRRSASTVQARPPVTGGIKRKASAEVARVKRRRADGPSSDPAAELWGAILGHRSACSPEPASKGLTPSRGLGAQPDRPANVRQPALTTPTPPVRPSSSRLPPPVALTARPFQPTSARKTSSAAAPSLRTSQSAAMQKPTIDGFASRRPLAQAARIGGGGRALAGKGSIFRAAKWL